MQTHRFALSTALISCVLSAGGILPLTHAAEQPPSQIVNQLKKMREAAPHLRSKERIGLVNRCAGAKTVAPLLAPINAHNSDVNFIQHCVLAIGETVTKGGRASLPAAEHAAATKALLKFLSGRDARLTFVACETLGKLWRGKGGSTGGIPINAELLACMYKHWDPVLEESALLALASINGIKKDGRSMPPGTPYAELRKTVLDWFASNRMRLPALPQRPWPLKLHALVVAPDPPKRDVAVRILIEAAELYPVDPMLDVLAAEKDATSILCRKIRSILEALTGRRFPDPDPKVTLAKQVVAWRKGWYAAIKGTPPDAANDPTWMTLELSLRRYRRAPSEAMAQRIKDIRVVIAHVLADPGSIPVDASAAAKELLLASLASKSLITKTLAGYDKAADAQSRQTALRRLRLEVDKASTTVVGIQFAQAFLDRAHAAETRADKTSAEVFELLLGHVTQLPSGVQGDTPRERLASLAKWVKKIVGVDPPLKMPAP